MVIFTLYLVLLCTNLVITSVVQSKYITRELAPGVLRSCIRIYDCPPGNAILPCVDKYTTDTCEPCRIGYVQPKYVSSDQNTNLTSCFKPENTCTPKYERRPSRLNNAKGCGFAEFCECDTYECRFGTNPCLCHSRDIPCGIGETMDNSGNCVPCPEGTMKNKTGCGPCTHITWITKATTKRNAVETTKYHHDTSSQSVLVQEITHTPGIVKSKDRITDNGEEDNSKYVKEIEKNNTTEKSIMIITIVVLFIAICAIIAIKYHRFKRRTGQLNVSNDTENGSQVQNALNNVENFRNNDPDHIMANNQSTEERNGLVANDNVRTGDKNGSVGLNMINTFDDQQTNVNQQSSSLPCESINRLHVSTPNSNSLPLMITKVINQDTSITTTTMDSLNNGNIKEHMKSGEKMQPSIFISLHNDVDNSLGQELNLESLKEHSGQYHTQMTECNHSPVTQETEINSTNSNKDYTSEVFMSDNGESLCSPMSILAKVRPIQEYGYLVSESDRYTESINSCLEIHNYGIAGQTCSISTDQNRDSNSKPYVNDKQIDSGMYSGGKDSLPL